MKLLTTPKMILLTALILTTIFSCQMIRERQDYNGAIDCITREDYKSAIGYLKEIPNYRDANTLIRYCKAMKNYDAGSLNSIYTTYHEIDDIKDDFSNEELTLEFTKTTSEVSAMYNNLYLMLDN